MQAASYYGFLKTLAKISDHKEFNQLLFLTIINDLIPFAALLGAEGIAMTVFLEGFLYVFGQVWFG